MSAEPGDTGLRVRREPYRAPGGGLTPGALAILTLDIEDELVSKALDREIPTGRVVDCWAAGSVRFFPWAQRDRPGVAHQPRRLPADAADHLAGMPRAGGIA
jgi:hypothetical protein